MRLLIANPNTSSEMLDLMLQEARGACRVDTEIDGMAASFGVPYIATPSELAIAGYALLELLARHHAGYDAIIIGAFCHSFVAAAKELMPVPVIGLAEAGLRAAQLLGKRVCVLGLGSPERTPLDDVGHGLEGTEAVVSVRNLPMSGTELIADQACAEQRIIEIGLRAVHEDCADVLVLGGAAYATVAPRIAEQLPVPVVAPVHFAVAMTESVVLSCWRKPRLGSYRSPAPKPTTGLALELSAFFADQY